MKKKRESSDLEDIRTEPSLIHFSQIKLERLRPPRMSGGGTFGAPADVGRRSSITNHQASVCSRSICFLVALFDPPGVLMFHREKQKLWSFPFSVFFHFKNSWLFRSKHGEKIVSVARTQFLIPDKQFDWMRGWDSSYGTVSGITPPQQCHQVSISGFSRPRSLCSRPSLSLQRLE